MNQELASGEVPGTLYGLSENGWMTRKLFMQWFHYHFLPYAPKARPIVLLMDGHSTHYCSETIRTAAANQVILCTLPPHTTHLCQPLHRSCFAALKSAWRQACQVFCAKNPGKEIGTQKQTHIDNSAGTNAHFNNPFVHFNNRKVIY